MSDIFKELFFSFQTVFNALTPQFSKFLFFFLHISVFLAIIINYFADIGIVILFFFKQILLCLKISLYKKK